MCSIVEHDIKQPAYEDDKIRILDRLRTKHTTTEALEALGANFNFICIWLKLLEDNYDARLAAYRTAMKQIPKTIPTTMRKPVGPRQKVQKLMTEIGGGWYMGKITMGLPPLRIPKPK